MKNKWTFLSGLPMTMLGGVFLLLSFVLPRVGIALPIDPAWITVIVSGIPLLYLRSGESFTIPNQQDLLCPAHHHCHVCSNRHRRFICSRRGGVDYGHRRHFGRYDHKPRQKRPQKVDPSDPTQGRRIRGGEEELVSPEQIQTGDILRILPGETVPVDGVIIRERPPWISPSSLASPFPWTRDLARRCSAAPSTALGPLTSGQPR